MLQTDEISVALMLRDYAAEAGRPQILIRDLRRALRSKGLYKIGEARFYDALKEMADAGWVTDIDYKESYVNFDPAVYTALYLILNFNGIVHFPAKECVAITAPKKRTAVKDAIIQIVHTYSYIWNVVLF